MKRLASLCLLLCLCWLTVGCGGSGKPLPPEANLEDESNLEADMAEQAKMTQEGTGPGGAPPGMLAPTKK